MYLQYMIRNKSTYYVQNGSCPVIIYYWIITIMMKMNLIGFIINKALVNC